MPRVYVYVVDRDFGFAPNPFHGCCTLATCKPILRRTAAVGDWVVGMGGGNLEATGKCIFAMQVTSKISFQEYWDDHEFYIKRPVRNGSKTMLLGDNIYRKGAGDIWIQADSHHSNEDGSQNHHNTANDTQTDAVLISRNFYYFGASAPEVPSELLESLPYKNGRGHRVYNYDNTGKVLIDHIVANYSPQKNKLLGLPFQFSLSAERYDVHTNRITHL